MAYVHTRLHLYAILSAMEADLRTTLWRFVGVQIDADLLLPAEVILRARDRFSKDDENDDGEEPTVRDLLEYSDFQDPVNALGAHAALLPAHLKTHLRKNGAHLQRMAAIRNRVMHTRPLLANDLLEVSECAKSLSLNAPDIWFELTERLELIRRNPSFVLTLSIPQAEDESHVFHNLPVPDFDETGFIGRLAAVKRVRDALMRGAHPVVSLVGDGGIGKTALALKVVYDIADEPGCPFDAIVWTSAKSTRLTGADVSRIHDAISSSLGLFGEAARQILPAGSGHGLDELLEYLSEFRILLVLDNLETVLDATVIDFLSRLPTGSKVLITSRIGVGAFENRIRIGAMDAGECVQLMRAIAATRNLSALSQHSNQQLMAWAERMHNSPGFIKWFAAAVQVGQRPEDALAHPDVFLDFCMSNVWAHVSASAKRVIGALLLAQRELSLSELSFLLDAEPYNVQDALQESLATSLLEMRSKAAGSGFETRFELASLAREYVVRHHPPDPQFVSDVLARQRQLTSTVEEIAQQARRNPFSLRAVSIRTSGDSVVARQLLDALNAAKRDDFDTAFSLVERAKRSAPDYSEVYRVEAFLASTRGDLRRAQQAYETGLELSPDSAPLRYFYGGFLSRGLADYVAARQQLERAHILAPSSLDVKLELARIYVHSHHWDESLTLLNAIADDSSRDERQFRKLSDLRLQLWQRRADAAFRDDEYETCLNALEQLRAGYDCLPLIRRDARMRHKLQKAILTSAMLKNHWTRQNPGAAAFDRCAEIDRWLRDEASASPQAPDIGAELALPGIVVELPFQENFGFIEVAGRGVRVFFHRHACVPLASWDDMAVSDSVSVTMGRRESDGAEVASRVERMYTDVFRNRRALAGQQIVGTVMQVQDKFGFLRLPSGLRFFFHRVALDPLYQWSRVEVDGRVEALVTELPDGRVVAQEIRPVG